MRTVAGPFTNGRALPSKWEDAERWITSPPGNPPIYSVMQRRPMSKSGPIPPSVGPTHYRCFSGAVEDGVSVRPFVVSRSPFSAGVLLAEGSGQSYLLHINNAMVRSDSSVPGCSDLLSNSLPSSQALDEELEGEDVENVEPDVVSQRDMATQMSPEGSVRSSLRGWPASPSLHLQAAKPNNHHFLSPKSEMRDVQVDKWATVLRQWSKKHGGGRASKRDPPDVEDLFKNAEADARAWPWDVADASKMYQREEAKITAWENLQKAKAEAALKKLEMNLEKKRSSSMDKIMKKQRSAERKAHEMRSSISDKLAERAYSNKNVHKGLLSRFLTCNVCK